MPDTGQYIDVRLLALNISQDLHERLLHAIHLCCVKGNSLAVSWPAHMPMTGLGATLRVFGNSVSLQAFQDMVRPLCAANLLELGDISVTPQDKPLVTFFRDRRAEKAAGYLERQNRHEEKVGRRLRKRVTEHPCPYYVKVRSGTTKQGFSLFINYSVGDADKRGGGNYGLGHPVPNF